MGFVSAKIPPSELMYCVTTPFAYNGAFWRNIELPRSNHTVQIYLFAIKIDVDRKISDHEQDKNRK